MFKPAPYSHVLAQDKQVITEFRVGKPVTKWPM